MDAALTTYQNIADKQARDERIVSHLGYVRHILGKLAIEFPGGVDIENLEAAGVLGLVEAADRYSPEHGVEFKTFAYQRVRGAILDELRRNCPLPQKILNHWALIREVIQSHEGAITPKMIAQKSGLTVNEVDTALVSIRMTQPEKWSEDLSNHAESRAGDADPAVQAEQESQLADAIEQLPERQRVVITLYHLEDLTLKQIGNVIGVSESRVSRILTQAELQLKKLVEQSTRKPASP